MKKVLLVIIGLFFVAAWKAGADSGDVTVTGLVPGCGDGIIQVGEGCDGVNLNNQTCLTLGFTGGSLGCRPECVFDTNACTTTAGGGSGGGGGGSYGGETGIRFAGRAYPLSRVIVLKDGQSAVNTLAGPDAKFSVALSGLSAGDYVFALYGEDSSGRRSSLFTFPVSLTRGVTTDITGIFISPTIGVDKSEVRRGDNLAIFGQSTPVSQITVEVNSPQEIFLETSSDENGIYLLNFNTAVLNFGNHSTKSRSETAGLASAFGYSVGFLVGTRNVATAEPAFLKGDLNVDGRVNLIDFSIAAYWYRRTLDENFARREAERLNGDQRIDLVDFSIMAFYWTG